MISKTHFLFQCLIWLCAISCSESTIDIPGFDEEAWQSDKDGCTGVRQEMRNDLIKIKDELKGLNGDQIRSILGKPNKTNLAKRNQKYFLYNISCPSSIQEEAKLSIRFSAVGLSYEVIVY